MKSEQDSNLDLPITGRLFYQLNYPIFSLILRRIAYKNIFVKINDNMWWSILFVEEEICDIYTYTTLVISVAQNAIIVVCSSSTYIYIYVF